MNSLFFNSQRYLRLYEISVNFKDKGSFILAFHFLKSVDSFSRKLQTSAYLLASLPLFAMPGVYIYYQLWNFIPDCKLEENFQCSNSTNCLPKSKRCDGIVDCWDKSDETNCHKGRNQIIVVAIKKWFFNVSGCPTGQFTCTNGQCIPRDHFCDGTKHCLDSSDEPQGCLV